MFKNNVVYLHQIYLILNMRSEEVKNTVCKKCVWKKYDDCPYEHELNEDKTFCRVADTCKSPYWRKKDREAKEAERLGKLVLENEIMPKYKIGDKVWIIEGFGGLEKYPEEYVIRKIIASHDGKSYRYQVKGHTEYTYGDDSLFTTEAAAMQQIVSNFITSTIEEAQRLSKQCKRLGVDFSGKFKAMLENKKE